MKPSLRHPHARYLFVCGLHRTGTSLIARLMAAHPAIDAIEGAPVPENEGAYLQGAIPHTALHGIPGEYATDPAQHLVEGCRHDSLAVRERIEHDWNRWFTRAGTWRVEKSPVNLTRMRLYQQLFPLSQFIVILRHPEAMAAALAKWTERPASELIDYALDAYEIALSDLRYIHAGIVLRYEDLVACPSEALRLLATFCEVEPHEPAVDVHDGNARYEGAARMNADQARRAQALGYAPGLGIGEGPVIAQHQLRSVRAQVTRLAQELRAR